jgi:hypothetical protein
MLAQASLAKMLIVSWKLVTMHRLVNVVTSAVSLVQRPNTMERLSPMHPHPHLLRRANLPLRTTKLSLDPRRTYLTCLVELRSLTLGA